LEAQWKANVRGPEWKGGHKERAENKKEKHFSSLSSDGCNVIGEGTILLMQLNQRLLCQEYLVILLKSKCKKIVQTSACLKREQGKPLKVLYSLLAHEILLFSSVSYLIIKIQAGSSGMEVIASVNFFFFFLFLQLNLTDVRVC